MLGKHEFIAAAVIKILHANVGWIRSHRSITLAYKSIEAWEEITTQIEDKNTRECHEQLIRLAKGQIKAWRVWLVQRRDKYSVISHPENLKNEENQAHA